MLCTTPPSTRRSERDAESRILERLDLADGAFAVATIHRAENIDDPVTLSQILNYLRGHAEGQTIVLPLHPRIAPCRRRSGFISTG